MKRTELLTELHKLRGSVRIKEEIHDMIEGDSQRIEMLRSNLKDCRNELCINCGKYRESYKGACNGCRWHEDESWLI